MELTKLEQEALKRKERLKNLKRKHSDSNNPDDKSKEALPTPKFRSYKPQAEELVESDHQAAKPANVEAEVEAQLKSAKEAVTIEHLDIATLAPRKQDWDLKRDITKKLEYLERKTQKAIAELIREELKKRQDLADVVSVEMPESKLITW